MNSDVMYSVVNYSTGKYIYVEYSVVKYLAL